jgi:hypothetical protein
LVHAKNKNKIMSAMTISPTGSAECKLISTPAPKGAPVRKSPSWFAQLFALMALMVASAPAAAVSIWSNDTVPTNPAANDLNAVEVGLKFRSSVGGYITGIRFYKGPGNTGTHVGHLWTADGVLLGSATFGAETDSGWQQQTLPAPVAIAANTTYLVSYHAPVGQYAADVGYFASAGVLTAPLEALADGVDGPNGVYAYGPSGTFPNQTFNAANYWVDVVFQETVGADTTAPTIVVIDPEAGASGVSSSTVVTVAFSEPMDAATITGSTVVLRDSLDNPVAATVTYVDAMFAAVLIPNSPLNAPETYTVTVSGGAAGVKDLAGNALENTFTSSFTTGAATTYTIWDDSVTPTVASANDPDAIELGLKFRSAASGFVTGIRFYKGPANIGPHTGNLWTADGTLLASVTFANETAAGWQTQALPAAVPIESNTTYVVSYHTPTGGYAVDIGYFAAGGVDSDPLRALADGEAGGNGVYAYSANSTFPNQTFNAANYWVDVVVAIPADSGCEGDVTPPVLVAPPNVLLTGGDCETDPSVTGTAVATDECTVTVTYSDKVITGFAKVVKRTWIATDGAGNESRAMQTITCLPASIVTDSARGVFDRDPTTPVPDFRLIFIQDPLNWPCYRLVASNPGQFIYNVFYTGTPGQSVTLNVTVPYPFVTKGSNPIQAYNGVSVLGTGSKQYLVPGARFFASPQQVKLEDYGATPSAFRTIPVTLTVPSSGVVYLAVHLEYGFKGMTGFSKNFNDDAIDCATRDQMLVPNHGTYQFSVSGSQNDSTAIKNYNAFKHIPGVAGLVLRKNSSEPVPGTMVTMKNAWGLPVGMGITDEDGFYMIPYRHLGREATFQLRAITPPPNISTATQTTKLKANKFERVDFVMP